MKNVVVFGTKDFAQLAKYYLDKDPAYSDHTVVAFTVNAKYIDPSQSFEGLPVVPFEEIEGLYSPDDYMLFAPMSGVSMNALRSDIYEQGKQKGYRFCSYISSRATTCDSVIGENCFILEDNTLQPFTTVGNNVMMWSGNHIGHHGKIDDHVFFSSHVVMSGHCHIKQRAWLGVNSTLRDGITIGEGSLIAMGSLVTRSTEDGSFYMGVPAKKQSRLASEVY